MTGTKDLENEYIEQFINALQNDIYSGEHSAEVNGQVLEATIYLLQNREKHAYVPLKDLLHGAINMAISLQDSKYGIITEAIGVDEYQQYIKRRSSWFAGYNKQLDNSVPYWKAAFPVILRASKAPLYITPYLSETSKVYFDYLHKLDENFVAPELPVVDGVPKLQQNQFMSLGSARAEAIERLHKEINRLFKSHWYFRDASEKINVLVPLVNKIANVPLTSTAEDILTIIKNWENEASSSSALPTKKIIPTNNELLGTHRNVFFSPNRPGVATATQDMLQELKRELGEQPNIGANL